MIIDWSLKEIQSHVDRMVWACTDPRQDGFTTWRCKQDLHRVKYMIEDALARCPEYSVEEEWLEQQQLEREKQQVWKTLNETNPK